MSGSSRSKRIFQCQQCGYETGSWLGRCPSCSTWNSLVESVPMGAPTALRPTSARGRPVRLSEVQLDKAERMATGLSELDRILGGGAVRGSALLIGGDPGVGKSTLLLQVLEAFSNQGSSVLYASGEESLPQMKIRAERLNLAIDRLHVLAETDLDAILSAIESVKADVIVVDSVQTIQSAELVSPPGSVSQVRECAHTLIEKSKAAGQTLFLVGHITKEGGIAGPKLLEHMVDTVLYFEGDEELFCRALRVVKHRFGPTPEVGLFEMGEKGLRDVSDPSRFLVSQSRSGQESGAAVSAVLSGTRPLLLEVQALVIPTRFGAPRRTTVGCDPNRAAALAAVMEKKLGWNFSERDLFVKVVGGLKMSDPGLDLGIVGALASSYLNRPLPPKSVHWGEVGLTGEVRPVPWSRHRLKEAEKLQLEIAFAPELSAPSGIEIPRYRTVRTIEEWASSIFA